VSSEISGTNTIDFTWDQPVTIVNQTRFYAVSSNGDETQSTTATVLSTDPKTVRVTFSGGGGTNIANYLEEVVQAWADDAAVQSSNNVTDLAQGKPAGDNANGKAPGYTNGPDATMLTLLKGTGQMVVAFDQRINSNAASQPVQPDGATVTPLGDWIALDANGSGVGSPTSATVESSGAFTSQVRLGGFNPVLIDQGVVKALEIVGNQACGDLPGANRASCGVQGGNPYTNGYLGFSTEPAAPGPQSAAVFTFGTPHGTGASGMNPAGNVQQILAPNATQSIARLLKNRHWVKATGKQHHKKHHKHHRK